MRISLSFTYLLYISTEGQLTSVACSTAARGIHKIPKMLSQSKPFFHSSIVKPFSSALISLKTINTQIIKLKMQALLLRHNTDLVIYSIYRGVLFSVYS